MSTANKVLIHRWFEEVWNKKRESAIDEMLTPDCLIYGVGPEPLNGPQEFREFWRRLIGAFPDIEVAVESTLAEEDKVAARCSVRGRHSGPGLNMEPTNRSFAFTGICLAHVREGRFCEGWNNFDFLLLYQQLGVLPQLA